MFEVVSFTVIFAQTGLMQGIFYYFDELKMDALPLYLSLAAGIIMGVIFWIAPRFQSSRGDVRLVWGALFFLNAGVWLVSLTAVIDLDGWNIVAGRLAEIAAVAAFAWHTWPRIKAIGQ